MLGTGVDHEVVRPVPARRGAPARPSCTTGSRSACGSRSRGHILFAFRDPDALRGMRAAPSPRVGTDAPPALVRGGDGHARRAPEDPRASTRIASEPPPLAGAAVGSIRDDRHADPAPTPSGCPRELLPADGRFGSGPSKVRPDAVARLAAAGDGLPRHEPPPRRRDARSSRRIREGLAEAVRAPRRLRGAARQRRDDDVLGRGRVRARRAAQRAPRRSASSRRSSRPSSAAAPHLDDPVVDRVAARARTPSRRRTPTSTRYALTHNETSTGVMMEIRRRPAGDGVVLVDATSGAGGAPPSTRRGRRLLLRAAEGVRAPRAGSGSRSSRPRRIDRIERIAGSDRWCRRRST